MKTSKEIYESEAIDLVAIRIEQLKKKQEDEYSSITKNIRIKFELPPDVDIEITHERRAGFGPVVKLFDRHFEIVHYNNEEVTLYNDCTKIQNKFEYGQFILNKKGTVDFDMPDGEPLNEAHVVGKYIQIPQAREINENDSKPIYNHPTIIEKIFRQVKKLIKK